VAVGGLLHGTILPSRDGGAPCSIYSSGFDNVPSEEAPYTAAIVRCVRRDQPKAACGKHLRALPQHGPRTARQSERMQPDRPISRQKRSLRYNKAEVLQGDLISAHRSVAIRVVWVSTQRIERMST